MTDKRDIFVDFNSVEDGRVTTVTDLVSTWADVRMGVAIVAGDDQGNLCDATVLSVDPDGVVELELDEGSFRTAAEARLIALG
jgi:hypothetical protein